MSATRATMFTPYPEEPPMRLTEHNAPSSPRKGRHARRARLTRRGQYAASTAATVGFLGYWWAAGALAEAVTR